MNVNFSLFSQGTIDAKKKLPLFLITFILCGNNGQKCVQNCGKTQMQML